MTHATDTREGKMTDERIIESARVRMGPQFRRRADNALITLIDAEGALHDAVGGNIGSALADVCEGLRLIRDAESTR